MPLAVICGADRGTEVELFEHQNRAWLAAFLELLHDISSHERPDASSRG